MHCLANNLNFTKSQSLMLRELYRRTVKVSIVGAEFSMTVQSQSGAFNVYFVYRYVSNNRFYRDSLFNLPKDYSPKSRYCCHRSAISFGIGSQYLIYHSIGQPSCQNNTCHQHWLCPNTYHKGYRPFDNPRLVTQIYSLPVQTTYSLQLLR